MVLMVLGLTIARWRCLQMESRSTFEKILTVMGMMIDNMYCK